MVDPATPLRIGLVGAGMVSAFHLSAWSRCPGAEVVAVCDPDEAAVGQRARDFGISGIHSSLEAMLAAETLDALDIASPRHTHAALVMTAADAGLAVLCQKPLAPTLDEALELVGAVGTSIRLMVHENWRFRPHYRQVARWLGEGAVGRIASFRLTSFDSGLLADGSGVRPALVRQPYKAHVERMMIAETLVHHLDVARWLMGALEVTGARTWRLSADLAGEDAAWIALSTRDGACAVIEGSSSAVGYPVRAQDRLEILGTRGRVSLDGEVLELFGDRPARIACDLQAAYQQSYDDAIAHFAACLWSGAPFETGIGDNLETLRLVEAAYQMAGPLLGGSTRA